ncbi:SCO1664 family protein [Quadrisphaera granulorum]|uniref:SCO1664 family protein n=1 Tax=Quadrisphaera granulorum TaxID=317664 RepID=UPI003CCC5FB8
MSSTQHGEGDVLSILATGELEVVGRVLGASNTTLLARARLGERSLACVYKPVAGEAPLWDFPDGTLAGREVAASLLSAAGGWGVVPPTVLRGGEFGTGSVQAWVGPGPDMPDDDHDDDGAGRTPEPGAGVIDVVPPSRVPPGWLTVVQGEGYRGEAVSLVHADDPALARMAAFDAVVNNADRKGGHVLRGLDGVVYGVDHGLTFHQDPKLRTVLWGWAGRPLPEDVIVRLEATAAALDSDLADALAPLITQDEVLAAQLRVERLLERQRFPKPPPGGRALPWPPF